MRWKVFVSSRTPAAFVRRFIVLARRVLVRRDVLQLALFVHRALLLEYFQRKSRKMVSVSTLVNRVLHAAKWVDGWNRLRAAAAVARFPTTEVSGLHVFHHCVIAWNMWICVTYGVQAQTIFVTCMNTLVHLVMYSYYFLAALGPRAQPFLWWKRYLTQEDLGDCRNVHLRTIRTLTARMVEFWWGSYLANVLSQQNKKEDKERGASQVLVLGENVELPDNIYSLLKKGPKFSLEPVVQPHELLAFNRRVANRAPQEQHGRCLLEGVDALAEEWIRWFSSEDTDWPSLPPHPTGLDRNMIAIAVPVKVSGASRSKSLSRSRARGPSTVRQPPASRYIENLEARAPGLSRSPCQETAGTDCINFKHCERLYDADKESHFKIVPKLTSSHVKPSKLEKMNVRLATQVQLVQFVVLMVHNSLPLFFTGHFVRPFSVILVVEGLIFFAWFSAFYLDTYRRSKAAVMLFECHKTD
ncbi:hypothetical protein HPB50_003409 [Hyalomma asiaticum]|uniref:Uncharacterized protein n=1 Tax=Hyalomma asiaticum TaxID=266040 RepID=A0ACB7SK53_HYAAI|nr:hypothetical protein HPB50_003409 [Hyalomma asiaticum]